MLIKDKYQVHLMNAEGNYEYACNDRKVQEQPRLLLPLLKKVKEVSVGYLIELFATSGNLDKIDYPAHRLDKAVIYELSFFASATYALWYSIKTINAIKGGKEIKPMFTGKKPASIPKKKPRVCVSELACYFGRSQKYANFFADCEKGERDAKQLYCLATALAEAADRNFFEDCT